MLAGVEGWRWPEANKIDVHCGDVFARECISGIGNEEACLRKEVSKQRSVDTTSG